MPSPLFAVRRIAYHSPDERQRLHALVILTAGATLIDTDGPDGAAERRRLAELVDAGCADEYTYCDEHGPVVTTARGWYHVVTCPGARKCYTAEDWHPSN